MILIIVVSIDLGLNPFKYFHIMGYQCGYCDHIWTIRDNVKWAINDLLVYDMTCVRECSSRSSLLPQAIGFIYPGIKDTHLPPQAMKNRNACLPPQATLHQLSRRQARRHCLKGNPRVGSFAWEEWFA